MKRDHFGHNNSSKVTEVVVMAHEKNYKQLSSSTYSNKRILNEQALGGKRAKQGGKVT